MAGASIPYPVNYIINFSVLLAFAVVILTIASYRFYKSQAARAQRRQLTRREHLNLNMEGVKGRYPPQKIKKLMKINEMKQLREAEAAEREYVIGTSQALDIEGAGLRKMSKLKSDENRQSVVADKPSGSDGLQGTANDSVPQVPVILQDVQEDVDKSTTADGSSETAPVASVVVPTLLLPDEHNAEAGGDITDGGDFGTADSDGESAVLASGRNVGQSQNNAAQQRGSRLPDVTSEFTTSMATQTPPRDPQQAEVDSLGSFEDSD